MSQRRRGEWRPGDGLPERVLRVENSRFVAHAVFKKVVTDDGNWTWMCTDAAAPLYMVKLQPVENTQTFLDGPAKKQGWSYRWIRTPSKRLNIDEVRWKKDDDHGNPF